MIKFAIAGVGLLTGAISSCAGALDIDDGPTVDRAKETTAFEELHVSGAYDVFVTTGEAPSIRMSGPENRLDDIIFEREGDRLIIRSDNSSWNMGGDTIRIDLTTAMLTSVETSGASDIEIDRIETEEFRSSLSGAGEIAVTEMDVDQLRVGLSGAGTMKASGTANELDVSMSGAGEFDAPGLVSQTASLRVSGAGDIDTQVTGEATGSVSGAGDIRVRGGATCSISESGAGDVDCE